MLKLSAFLLSCVPVLGYKALVYNGPGVCKGCPDSVADLLSKRSGLNFDVKLVGPEGINADALNEVDLYAYGGGPDVDSAWKHLTTEQKAVQDWVSNGGRYLGICLGAYLASDDPGYALLPNGVYVDSEYPRHGSQVKNDSDTIIQVDWTWQTGAHAGQTVKNRWAYFQEGNVVLGITKDTPNTKVIARYSSNGDVAASINALGDGFVGLSGVHVEADQSWYDDYNLTNPDGIKFDLGKDLVNAVVNGFSTSSNDSASHHATPTGHAAATDSATSGGHPLNNPLMRLAGLLQRCFYLLNQNK